MNRTTEELTAGAAFLEGSLELCCNPQAQYLRASDNVRRLVNETYFEHFFIDQHGQVAEVALRPPFDEFGPAAKAYVRRHITKNNSTPSDAEGAASVAVSALPELAQVFLAGVSSKTSLVGLVGRYSNYAKLLKRINQIVALQNSTWSDRSSTAAPPARLAVHLDDVAVKQLAADYEVGATGRELAECYGSAPSSVIKLLRDQGVAVRHPRTTPDEQAEMVRLYRVGVSQVEIAERFGRHKGVVWHVLNRLGEL